MQSSPFFCSHELQLGFFFCLWLPIDKIAEGTKVLQRDIHLLFQQDGTRLLNMFLLAGIQDRRFKIVVFGLSNLLCIGIFQFVCLIDEPALFQLIGTIGQKVNDLLALFIGCSFRADMGFRQTVELPGKLSVSLCQCIQILSTKASVVYLCINMIFLEDTVLDVCKILPHGSKI